MKMVLLLLLIGFMCFWGGFGCGVECEHLNNKHKEEDKEEFNINYDI